jgi:hypothetical protein
MAKRTTPRAPVAGEAEPPATPRRASRATSKKNGAPDVERVVAADSSSSSPTTPDQLPNIPEPGDIADRALRSESMASEPSEEDIRLRAYHRYLERGGGHGRHFDDWLEAERELRGKR